MKKLIDKPYNKIEFTLFLDALFEEINLKALGCCVFIMDNVAFHKVSGVREKFPMNGHSVEYLPPYSPSLNPIENAFAKWKNIVRRANCQTQDELFEKIGSGWNEVTSINCDGYYRNMKRDIRKSSERLNIE
jgi:transposase